MAYGTALVGCVVAGLATALCWFCFGPGGRQKPIGSIDRRPKKVVYAFFHPYASGGGGGERVLWKMIQFLQSLKSHRALRCGANGPDQSKESAAGSESDDEDDDNDDAVEIVIYTIDPPSTNERDLRMDAERRFDVSIPKPVRLVSLEEHKDCLLPRPFLSMVMESWGTMKLARRALLATLGEASEETDKEDPGSEFVFCDTTGCAFTFLVVWWMRRSFPTTTTTRIMAYVHYPTISTDMMAWEWQRDKDNRSLQRRIRTCIKLVYYYFFALAYGITGSLADLVMVNSTWTYNHIHALWRFATKSRNQPIEIVYPPCRVPDRVDHSGDGKDEQQPQRPEQRRENTIVSIGQFRPEKNHKLQIEALSVLLKTHPELRTSGDDNPLTPVRLRLIGSCRNDADRGRVDELRKIVGDLDLGEHVIFDINPPYSELQASMFRAKIGIHTMRQEHFGIGIVEMMAAGLLTIAHNSGGPKSDIVLPGDNASATGFLAITAEEYAEAMHRALAMDDRDASAMRHRARASATRFSDSAFDQRLERVLPLLYC